MGVYETELTPAELPRDVYPCDLDTEARNSSSRPGTNFFVSVKKYI
jgi:hypothetical protein